MAARSVWKGHIRFSLVTIPVKAYTASQSSSNRISLNQIHKDCGARVKYMKYCPVHGEIPNDEIVSGYEYAKDQYAIIDTEEVEKLRPQSEKAIGIDAFIDREQIGPRFYNGKVYYLVPDGPIGRKPYGLLHRAMADSGKVAFAQGVFQNREQIMLLRPEGKLLGAMFLSYHEDYRAPAEFEPEVGDIEIPDAELKLAETLVTQLTDEAFDFASYKDKYMERLAQLVEAKVQGRETVQAPAAEEPQVTNLMEALQRSLDAAKAKAGAQGKQEAKPPKLQAAGTATKRKTAARKKKSS